MKVLRSTLVAAVAILAAACGDKVNVVGPSTADTTPKVNSVTVSPSRADITLRSVRSALATLPLRPMTLPMSPSATWMIATPVAGPSWYPLPAACRPAGVARALGKIRKGQIVKLSGYLVEIKAKDGWSWRSSMTRDDTGQGSCEVIFVQAVNASG